MRLLESPPALTRVDELLFDGVDIKEFDRKQMESILGRGMSVIFQDALTALNPVMTVGRQIDEVYMRHFGYSRQEAREASIKALKLVEVPSAERRYRSYPHELSGGMRQRVMIAMAFACMPKLIIADEPTTALDVTIQLQILNLLNDMQKKHNTALLLITHDLSVVSHMADRVYVMYAGKIVEEAGVKELFESPRHPYTKALVAAVPRLDDDSDEFRQIPEAVPNPLYKPAGCYFHPRCDRAAERCRTVPPQLMPLGEGRFVRCHDPLPGEEIR